ncbi:MAG: PP2C family protein-serine/threonine phosphatase [Phycisphaerales bacterium]
MTQTFTTEFTHEFEAERAQWLRRRFRMYTGVVGALGVVSLLLSMASPFVHALPGADAAAASPVAAAANIFLGAVSTASFLVAYFWTKRTALDHHRLMAMAHWLIVGNGLLQLVAMAIVAAYLVGAVEPGKDTGPAIVQTTVLGMMVSILLTHLFACAFLPWTPRECVRPLLPLFVAYAVVSLVLVPASMGFVVASIALSPLVALPGLGICWWRHSRFKDRFLLRTLRGRYGDMRRELTDARRLHEALFPHPEARGTVAFAYRYEPARQIGGDFVYARFHHAAYDEEPTLSLTLLDVTGHGVAAALTVNRLYGEIERLFAENPDLGPGECLRALNRYVHLTLATHEVYATATCLRVDPNHDMLHYASAGHPPAFLRAVHGTIDELPPTAMMLGVLSDAEFEPAPQPRRFGKGDTLIAYTDGAIECAAPDGKMLGIAGIQRAIASAAAMGTGDWTKLVLTAVDRHRQRGPITDDTLVVEVARLIVEAEVPRQPLSFPHTAHAHHSPAPPGSATPAAPTTGAAATSADRASPAGRAKRA